MKKVLAILATIIFTVLLTIPVNAAGPEWYEVSFTGKDIWTYSLDEPSKSRLEQTADRKSVV